MTFVVKRTVNAETGKYFQLLAAPDYAGFPAEGCTSIPPNHSRVYAARCLSDCSSTSRGSRTITKRAWKKPRPLVGRVFRVTTCASQHLVLEPYTRAEGANSMADNAVS